MFLFTILNNMMETEQGLVLADGAMCPRSVSAAAAKDAQFHQLQLPAAPSKTLSASHCIAAHFPFLLPPHSSLLLSCPLPLLLVPRSTTALPPIACPFTPAARSPIPL